MNIKDIDINNLSDMFKEYVLKKQEFQNEILLYRVGDFYETYFEDAILVSEVLGLTLTSKSCGKSGEKAEMAGVPQKALGEYIKKLVQLGYKVAVAEQIEDPKDVKGRLVKRDVVKVITNSTYIDENSEVLFNNYLCVVHNENNYFYLVFSDIVTGEIYFTEVEGIENLLNELARYQPVEILLNKFLNKRYRSILEAKLKYDVSYTVENDLYNVLNAENRIRKAFNIGSIKALGLTNYQKGLIEVLSIFLNYVEYTQRCDVSFSSLPVLYHTNDYMDIDIDTRRNLELSENINGKGKYCTLVSVLDKTSTSMGSRLLRQWIEKPLLKIDNINLRLDGVEEILKNESSRNIIEENLKHIFDLSRILGRLKLHKAVPKDLDNLRKSLEYLPNIKDELKNLHSDVYNKMNELFDNLEDLKFLLDRAIKEDPSNNIKDGDVIKEGYNKNLDEYRDLIFNTNKYISSLEEREKESTGIKNLRIANISDGYFFEVTNSNLDKVPDYFIYSRKLSNYTRYKTDDLEKLEKEILTALEKSKKIENELFEEIKSSIVAEANRINIVANILSTLDVLISFAKVSLENNYNRPSLNEDGIIDIKENRHAVIEKLLKDDFICNDIYLDMNDNNMLIITGPNMAGKSTYMRQTAISVIMAQIGCFVPAKEANISIIDKIFTRIGASDDISSGKSTFMVEMEEVKNILFNATEKSLIIFDEVGRGTSTFDGLAIAQAIVEYVVKNIKAKTLFATHYHELIEMEGKFKCIKNYHIKVDKTDNDLKFLRKIESGGVDESYGIDVANLAGLPKEVIFRAREILEGIEQKSFNVVNSSEDVFSDEKNSFIKEIANMDFEELGPVQTYKILNDLIEKARGFSNE